MNDSITKSALIEALCKATLEFEPILKDENAKVKTKSGSEYGYSYASLDMIILATRKALASNGLNITHYTEEREGKTWLVTELRHSSGCPSDKTESSIDKFTADSYMSVIQNFGSIITYLKRYHIAMLLNVAIDEDNDGKAKESTKKPQQQSKEQPKTDLDTLKAKYFSLANQDEQARHKWQFEFIGKESTKDWQIADYTKAINILEKEKIEKQKALSSIEIKLNGFSTIDELDKWVANQTKLSESKMRKEIEGIIESRRQALSVPAESTKPKRTELIGKIGEIAGRNYSDVNAYVSDEMLAGGIIAALLSGEAGAIQEFNEGIAEFLASQNEPEPDLEADREMDIPE
jgi:uncharacterized protein YqfB (UPF0267 family)